MLQVDWIASLRSSFKYWAVHSLKAFLKNQSQLKPWLQLNKHFGTSFRIFLIQYKLTLLKTDVYPRGRCNYFGCNLISLKNYITVCQIWTPYSLCPSDPIKSLSPMFTSRKPCVQPQRYKTNWRKSITQLQSFLRCLSSDLYIC